MALSLGEIGYIDDSKLLIDNQSIERYYEEDLDFQYLSGTPTFYNNQGQNSLTTDFNFLFKQIFKMCDCDTLKQSYPGTNAWFITSNLEALKFVGLKPSRKIKLFNGSLESRLVKYEMYEGSKRTKFQEVK